MSDRKTPRASKSERRNAVKKVRAFALKQKGRGISQALWGVMTPKESRK